MVFLVLWRVVVILILVLVSVSVLGFCYHRVGSRSSIWILGRFVYMDCFGSFIQEFSVFGLFSYSFLPLSASFVYRPFCFSPWVHLFHSMVSWSVLFVFWLCFLVIICFTWGVFVRWNYRQLLVGSRQQGFRISCVVVVLYFPEGLHDLIKLYSGFLEFTIM